MKKRIVSLLLITLLSIQLLASCSAIEVYYRITFIVEGKKYDSITTAGNEQIPLPKTPKSSQKDLVFIGWYPHETDRSEPALTTKTYAYQKLTSNVKYYAHFTLPAINEKQPYTLIIDDYGEITGIRLNTNEPVDIVIPEGCSSIGTAAFMHLGTSLKSVTLPVSLAAIGDSAFTGCTSLTEIIIPEGSLLKSIGTRAFYGCTSLQSIIIPAAVQEISSYAFGSTGLTEAYFADTEGWSRSGHSSSINPAVFSSPSLAASLLTSTSDTLLKN